MNGTLSPQLMFLLAIALLSLCVALVLVWRLSRPGARLQLLDTPNARSLHERPVSRTGGLGIISGLAAGLLVLFLTQGLMPPLGWMLAGLCLVVLVSLLDDWTHLPAASRLAVHACAAALCIVGGIQVSAVEIPGLRLELPTWAAAGLSGVFLVWMINLYNFMDGMDGFAAGMAVLGFGGLGVLGLLGGDVYFAAIAFAVSGAAAGFLVFNFPPARIFMGDAGSASLGYLAGALALWGGERELFPLWQAGLLFAPFVLDATATVLRRLRAGARVWEAHRSHYYQRLVTAGWGHRRTVLWGYGLMVFSVAAAVCAARLPPLGQLGVLGLSAAIYIATMRWVDKRAPFPGAP